MTEDDADLSELSLDEERIFAAAARIFSDCPPKLRPLLVNPSRYKGAYGGRGGAKSHFFASMAIFKCIKQPRTRGVCIREIQKSLKDSVKLLVDDKIRALGLETDFGIKNDSIETPGGGIIVFQGMQDHTADSIKSLEGFDWAYVEEAQTLTERSLELLRPTIRKPGSELWFAWNPRHDTDPVDALLRRECPPDSRVVEVNWRDNPHFPDVLQEERKFDYKHNPQRYRHIWEGAYEPQAVGALWTGEIINRFRSAAGLGEENGAIQFTRILVAIDPAASSEKGSDETGIILCALGADGRAYVLEDHSMVGKPDEWATKAIALFDLNSADNIVIEANMGGEMCVNTFRAIRPGLPITAVHATRGKHIRAEPIAALYAIGKVSHVGAFPELEHQMCQMTADGYKGTGSPDRCDALVWGMTALFSKLTRREPTSEVWKLAPQQGRIPLQKRFIRETRYERPRQ